MAVSNILYSLCPYLLIILAHHVVGGSELGGSAED
jgi:hypothetical protein